MKKIILGFLLLCSQSAFSSELDMKKPLNCAVDVTGYDDVQKFSISGLKNSNYRDVEILSTGSGIHQNACEQTGDLVECIWDKSLISSYTVTLDLAEAQVSYNFDNDPEAIVIDGEIQASFGRTRYIRCTQSLY